MNLTNRAVIWLLIVLSPLMAWGYDISDFKESTAINAPQTAVLVLDLKTGETLVSHNAEKPLIPASIMKCVTTATLLEKVGNRYRYETPVYYTGSIHDGTLDGDIVVCASADPSVNSVHEPGSEDIVEEIVQALLALRVSNVKGGIIIDESDYPGPAVNPTWQSGDLSHAYGTGTHGFNFRDNASGSRSVADPSGVFRSRLRDALSAAGISIASSPVGKTGHRHRLGEHRSETIDEIMRSCMMRSDNQYAEAMLRTVGFEYGGEGSTERGAQEQMKYWKRRKATMEGVRVVDGSGLSRSNRVTANFMADVLRHMSGNPYYASFFPLAGQEGTLRKFLAGTELDGEIAMKTGSMRGIQCYAGYKLDSEYAPTHVVVVIMNEMANRAAARAEVQKLLLSTFAEE